MIYASLVAQLTEEAAKHLESSGVDVKEYDELLADVKSLAASGSRILMDPAKVFAFGATLCCLCCPPRKSPRRS